MSTYFNFRIIDLNEVTCPTVDEDGMYNWFFHPSVEDVTVGNSFSTRFNYPASQMVESFMASGLLNDSERKVYARFFGNMFWTADLAFWKSEDYLKDAWNIMGDDGRCEDYSISLASLQKIVLLESQIDFARMRDFFTDRAPASQERCLPFQDFFDLTQDWLTIYKLAISKNLGVVYDIG